MRSVLPAARAVQSGPRLATCRVHRRFRDTTVRSAKFSAIVAYSRNFFCIEVVIEKILLQAAMRTVA
jgi:hypothetical protein